MTSPAPSWTLTVEAADAACHRRDLADLSCHARRLIAFARRDQQYELVAIVELAALAEPLALERWRRLSAGLHRPPHVTGDATAAA